MSKKIIILCLFLLIMNSIMVANVSFAQTLQVTVKTDKTSYILREMVEISGNVTRYGDLVDSGLVGVQVENPLVVTVAIRTMPLGPNLNEIWPLEIVDFTPCDSIGRPKQTFLREQFAYFKVMVNNTSPFADREVIIAVTVCDNRSIPIEVRATKVTILAGRNVTYVPTPYIANWSASGTGTAYANVYSDWPKNGGRPYCPEKATTFSILDSEYDEDPPGQVVESTPQNGTYNTKFRMSPEPYPGLYTVSSSAWHKGYTAKASTSFQVTDVTAPPWPYFVIKPPIASPGSEVTFDAKPSSAEGYGDRITSFSWKFGDDTTGTGRVVKHTYTSVGNYTVTLNVTDTEGFWNTTTRTAVIAIIHDVAVIGLQSLNDVYNDWEVAVSMTVKNKGTVNENFSVKLYANSTLVATTPVTLGPRLTTTVTCTWNTSGLTLLATYTLKALIDPLVNETQTLDNTLEYGPIFVRLLGDVRFDELMEINILDVVAVTGVYATKEGDPNWDIMADLRRDGEINILDVVIVTSRYATKY